MTKAMVVRAFALNTSLILVSVGITLALLDLTVRVYAGLTKLELPSPAEQFVENPNNPARFDPVLGWGLRPGYRSADGSNSVNSLGMRSSVDWPAAALPKCTRKVLILGDSMVFGLGVQQPQIFTELLNREERGTLFINTGVIGYSTGQEYLVQQRVSNVMQFDLGIVFFTEDNDIWWNTRTTNFNAGFSLQDGTLTAIPPKPFNDVPFYSRSALYRLLDLRLFHGKDLDYLLRRIGVELKERDSYSWKVTEAVLREMKKTADIHGYPLIVIDLPTANQRKSTMVSRKRQTLLRETSAQLQMYYFDLLEHYPEPADSLFLKEDSHWNAKGHRFIADFLKSILPPHVCANGNGAEHDDLHLNRDPD